MFGRQPRQFLTLPPQDVLPTFRTPYMWSALGGSILRHHFFFGQGAIRQDLPCRELEFVHTATGQGLSCLEGVSYGLSAQAAFEAGVCVACHVLAFNMNLPGTALLIAVLVCHRR